MGWGGYASPYNIAIVIVLRSVQNANTRSGERRNLIGLRLCSPNIFGTPAIIFWRVRGNCDWGGGAEVCGLWRYGPATATLTVSECTDKKEKKKQYK